MPGRFCFGYLLNVSTGPQDQVVCGLLRVAEELNIIYLQLNFDTSSLIVVR